MYCCSALDQMTSTGHWGLRPDRFPKIDSVVVLYHVYETEPAVNYKWLDVFLFTFPIGTLVMSCVNSIGCELILVLSIVGNVIARAGRPAVDFWHCGFLELSILKRDKNPKRQKSIVKNPQCQKIHTDITLWIYQFTLDFYSTMDFCFRINQKHMVYRLNRSV